MHNSSLLGRKVVIFANDNIPRKLIAHIAYISESERKILLELTPSLVCAHVTHTHAVAQPRSGKEDWNAWLTSGTLRCGVICIPQEYFDPSHPVDISWWRGGLAAITDVVLDNELNSDESA